MIEIIKQNMLQTNIYTIFVFILIVSSNYLAQLFPCRFQYILQENMIVKHLLGYFTILFFVDLSSPLEEGKKISYLLIKSFWIYLFFILITKVSLHFFYLIIILLGMSYVIVLFKIENEKNKYTNNTITKTSLYDSVLSFLYLLVIVLVSLGLIVYLGEKKIEYGNQFKYITFFFGKINCNHKSPHVPFLKALQNAFT
jgi:hypothetical protein